MGLLPVGLCWTRVRCRISWFLCEVVSTMRPFLWWSRANSGVVFEPLCSPFLISCSSLLSTAALKLANTILANGNKNQTLIANWHCNGDRRFLITSDRLALRNILSRSVLVVSGRGFFEREHFLSRVASFARLVLQYQVSRRPCWYYVPLLSRIWPHHMTVLSCLFPSASLLWLF